MATLTQKKGKSKKRRKKSVNYSNLPDVDSLSHGDLYVSTNNVFIYNSLPQAHRIQSRAQTHSISEVFTVPTDTVLLLDYTYDESWNYRRCLLPMPGWVLFPQTENPRTSILTRPYGLVAIQNHPARTQSKILEDQEDKPNCISQCLHSGFIKKIILYFRMHPWLPNLIILFIQAGIEIVIFLDIVLDIIVILDLYDSSWTGTFTFACILLLSPYFIAWSVLFKFIEKNHDDRRYRLFTFLFTISPIGLLILVINDVYHVLECVFLKPIHFIVTCGRKLRSESFEELGYYKFRRVSEIFCESVMQAMMQLWILLHIKFSYREFDREVEVNPVAVVMAFVSSTFIIALWITILIIESKKNGMTFVEYVTVVFQGSFKFVPYLPAIMRGKETGKKVNWIYFRVRNSSVGTICNALLSPKCVLERVKLSGYSIKALSRAGCKLLGNMLRTNNIELIYSQKESHIKDLFDAFDISQSGAFDFEEFSRVMLVMRSFRAYSTNQTLLYSRMGNKRSALCYEELQEFEPSTSRSSQEYDSDSDVKRDVYDILDRIKDAEREEAHSIKQTADRAWTDTASNVTIDELIESYKILADKHHKKVWLLDLLMKVRSSTERLPCLDYDTPLYFAVKTNNIKLVSLLMSYGYHKRNSQEFEHCVIECVVNEEYKMALVLCEHEGIPIVVNIRRGHGIAYPNHKHNNEALNPFVTVTVFEHTSRTDVIYKSDASPLWNHYLLFVIPFDSIDDYIWLKTSWDIQLSANPLVGITNKTKKRRSSSFSESRHLSQQISRQKSRRNFLPPPIQLIGMETHLASNSSMEAMPGNSTIFSVHALSCERIPERARGDSAAHLFRSMRSVSVFSSNMMGATMDEPQFNEALENRYNYQKKTTFLMDFKLFHHEHRSQNAPPAQEGAASLYRKESEYVYGFHDVELAHRFQDLFHYEELVQEQAKRRTDPVVPMCDDNANEESLNSSKELITRLITMEELNEQKRSHNSYEQHFTTILDVKRAMFKGHAMRKASLDCRIHLSALKCYELYGLDYVEKTKDDFGNLFDASKYDDLDKPIEPYKHYSDRDGYMGEKPMQKNVIRRARRLFHGTDKQIAIV
eukprot:230608_1